MTKYYLLAYLPKYLCMYVATYLILKSLHLVSLLSVAVINPYYYSSYTLYKHTYMIMHGQDIMVITNIQVNYAC